MKDILLTLFGAPTGPIIFDLGKGALYTIILSLIAFIGGGIVGLLVTLMHVAPLRITRWFSNGYIWLFQSGPLLILLFLFALGLPKLFDYRGDVWSAAIFALTLYTSAYLADAWRGAVEAVPKGQWEGGYAIGLRFFGVLRRVIAPQAMRFAAAPTVGFMVQIIKGTSLAFIIGFEELMRAGKKWMNSQFSEPFIILPVVALVYFCMCFPLSVWARRLERRFNAERDRPHESLGRAAPAMTPPDKQ